MYKLIHIPTALEIDLIQRIHPAETAVILTKTGSCLYRDHYSDFLPEKIIKDKLDLKEYLNKLNCWFLYTTKVWGWSGMILSNSSFYRGYIRIPLYELEIIEDV